jgi:hypothetical protein
LERVSIHDVERVFTETKSWLNEIVKCLTDEYKTMLEMGKYEKAAEFYERAAHYQKCKPLMHTVDSDRTKENHKKE